MHTSQWTAGKLQDTFAPYRTGPVLADEVPDTNSLALTTRLNGTTVQAVSSISELVTFELEDIIANGTPAGVGCTREPPLVLQPGDVVEVEMEGVGTRSNPVVAAA